MDGNVLYFDLPLGGLGLKFEGESWVGLVVNERIHGDIVLLRTRQSLSLFLLSPQLD